jgi:AcrR family transcriptional regulator
MGRKSIAHLRKPDILKHTYRLVEEEGLAGMSINKIAKRMNVNPGVVMHYFKNKEGLILALVDYMLERAMTFYVLEFEKYEDPDQNFEHWAEYYFQPHENPPTRQSVFWSCYALSFRNAKVKERIQNMYRHFIAGTIKKLELYEKQELVKVDKKEEVATILLSLIEGFGYFRTTMGPDHPHFNEVLSFFKQKFLETMNATLRDNQQIQEDRIELQKGA